MLFRLLVLIKGSSENKNSRSILPLMNGTRNWGRNRKLQLVIEFHSKLLEKSLCFSNMCGMMVGFCEMM